MFHATLLILAAAVLPPDVLLPGQVSVDHKLVAQASPALEGHTLFAFPTAGFGGPHVVVPGEPFPFSDKYGTALYLIPDGVDIAALDLPTPPARLDFPSSTPPGPEISAVSLASPIRSVRTTFEVAGVEGVTLKLAVISVEKFRKNGQPVGEGRSLMPVLALVAAGAALGVVVLRSRRKARVTSTP